MSERRIVEDRISDNIYIEDETANDVVARLLALMGVHGCELVFRREYEGMVPGNFYLVSRRLESDAEYTARLEMERERDATDRRRARERIADYKARYPDLFE